MRSVLIWPLPGMKGEHWGEWNKLLDSGQAQTVLSLTFRGDELTQQIIVLALLHTPGEDAEDLKNVHLYDDLCPLGIESGA